jgi:DNA-binding winged helix-turn-helix (wHTH) protein/tetratricopeptide (TPR) repeat protein
LKKPTGHAVYAFGPFRIDIGERTLTRDGQEIQLTLKAFDTLALLVANHGRVVTKEQFLTTVWTGSFVGDGVLSVNILNLRKALGAREGADRFIETIPRRGYRFIAPVEEVVARAVAVLPFKILGSDKAEYLGIGIADALIVRLTKVRRLRVLPMGAVGTFTSLECDAIEAARDLAVDALVEGSIRESDGRIRVLVQMVDARTGAALWAEQFDEQFTDIFALEDRIAEQVSQTLLQELTRGERERLAHRVTASSDAYRLYLQGRYFWNKRTLAALQKGIGYFREAIDVDPSFARAWAGLADSELLGASPASPREAMERARAAATKALELDDSLAEAHTSLGRVAMSFDLDWDRAQGAFDRAIALNPNYATAHQWHANLLLALGRTEEALAAMQRARDLEPFSLILNTAVGWVLYMSRRYDEAIANYRATLEMEPHFGMALREIAVALERVGRCEEALEMLDRARAAQGDHPLLVCFEGRVHATAGRVDDARAALEELYARRTRGYVPAITIAVLHAALGEREQAIDALWEAYEERSSPLIWMKVDPWLDSLRTHERFMELMNRAGLRP